MSLWQWSPTAANNANAATNVNWAEGQAPSTVNDSARQMMADIATWFQAPEWLNLGDVPTYISGTQFTVPTNRTSVYTVGRRVRATVTAGTIYGTITASAFGAVTTVTVTWDSGALDNGVSETDVGMLNPAFSSFPTNMAASFTSLHSTEMTVNGVIISPANNQGGYIRWNEDNTGKTTILNNQGAGSGGFIFRNVNLANTLETGRVTFGGAGDITATEIRVNGVSLNPVNNQGCYTRWNEDGTGKTTLLNNQGSGNGGFIFRNINLTNTTETGRVSFSGSGNIVATGSITSSSDERLKKDWEPMASDFLERMASVLHGSFSWRESGERSAGVGAQSLREVFPEVVYEDDEGSLSVAYGQAALVAVLELIPIVLRLLKQQTD